MRLEEEIELKTRELCERLKDRYVARDPQDINPGGYGNNIRIYQGSRQADVFVHPDGMSVMIWEKNKTMFDTGTTSADRYRVDEMHLYGILDQYFERKKQEQMALF